MKHLIASLALVVACGDDAPDDPKGCATIFYGDTVPNRGDPLFEYLRCSGFSHFAAESAAHASTGPHGQRVRTYINGPLKTSLEGNAGEHPSGAAAVKVFVDTDGTTPTGFAVMVKTASTSAGGQGWYWYENFSATSGASPAADGNGVTACTGCHAGSASDFFMSPFPLQ